MGKLQDLIAALCPNGVEYKELGDIAELCKGSGLQKKDFDENGTVGCIHYGQIHTYFGSYTDHVIAHVSDKLAKKLMPVYPGDVIVAVTSEDVSACCKAVAWVGDETIVTGGHSVVIRHSLNPKFLAYCFLTDDFYRQKKRYAAGVKVVEMRTDRLARIKVPVPPREVQDEIVRLMDAYTQKHDALVMQLRSEIEQEDMQLSTFRETLLTFSERERE